jgi:hypothetical protein
MPIQKVGRKSGSQYLLRLYIEFSCVNAIQKADRPLSLHSEVSQALTIHKARSLAVCCPDPPAAGQRTNSAVQHSAQLSSCPSDVIMS